MKTDREGGSNSCSLNTTAQSRAPATPGNTKSADRKESYTTPDFPVDSRRLRWLTVDPGMAVGNFGCANAAIESSAELFFQICLSPPSFRTNRRSVEGVRGTVEESKSGRQAFRACS
ncbi:hypothetical protein Cob_v000332 [Colletotrichum orbiculare MAFF 240422]|uniref:Uncharacterized protein n=1 Tax=Colletotrichum orbiculare (strain 104-T / ATCC 96160 / CBS 514.97 / LARS 414 / MAFF 240422) TaxID=1213857 RepID=A0A484G8X9_COLOR|nr:hypothetical protein Cob_v000332 [Colletotrichum orbiculare MAFF 240422]